MLLNEKPLNFTIFKNTKLEGAISGPDRAPILQAQIWARSGRAFHYWSGARQITLLGPHFSLSGPDRRPTKISARDVSHLFLYENYIGGWLNRRTFFIPYNYIFINL